jgi:retron-type reverse transcriptase
MMKTYCKHLVVSDPDSVEKSILGYVHDKCKKNSTIRFYSRYSGKDIGYVKQNLKPGTDFYQDTNRKLAVEMALNIANRTVEDHLEALRFGLPLIRYTKITDRGSNKERELGLETVLFRLYEAVAKDAADPLFRAKLGEYQCSSIKGRGQNYGKKAVLKWTSGDPDGTKYNEKSDISKCYPSIPHDRLLELLHRDLHKSDELLYLFEVFIRMYEKWPRENTDPKKGILIGSPVSKDICNYYLSYAYHFASEKLVKTTTRRGVTKVKRLISHVIFYADDIVLYGANKRELQTAMNRLTEYMKDALGLSIKPDWRKNKSQYIDGNGLKRGTLLDYMGFRFHGGEVTIKDYFGRLVRHKKTWTTIRRKIFLDARRKLRIFEKKVKRKDIVKIKFARSLISVYGWFKNTNMVQYRKNNNVDKLLRIARRMVSNHEKGKSYKTETYYKMWRCMIA